MVIYERKIERKKKERKHANGKEIKLTKQDLDHAIDQEKKRVLISYSLFFLL